MIGNRIGVNPKHIFEEIYRLKRPAFVLKDVLEGLPSLQSKAEKGKSDIECVESGFTVCEHKYLINDFFRFINGNRTIDSSTIIRIAITTIETLKYLDDYLRGVIHYMSQS
jgi:DNA (cytosine-5)-methyltransferase 1